MIGIGDSGESERGRFGDIGDGDGDGLIGGVTGAIGGANGDDVGVVTSGIAYVGGGFVIRSGFKDQSASGGINGEFVSIISSNE